MDAEATWLFFLLTGVLYSKPLDVPLKKREFLDDGLESPVLGLPLVQMSGF